jgi:YVTN family beta-propeller protein
VTHFLDTVSVVDIASNAMIETISVGIFPRDVAITPDGSRAYVPDGVGAVWVIETATNTIVAGIEGLSPPERVAITPDGTRAYVTQFTTDNVAVIDTATNAVVATIGLGRFSLPEGVEITPDGSRVYVTSFLSSGPLWVIDSVSNSVIATITSIDCSMDIAFTPPAIPTDKEQCKRGGWRTFGPPAGPFRNQGQCISFVLHNEHR